MGKAKSPQSLAKLITYILGRRPDEFGLVTDTDGFVKIKELLKAITEEEGWKYVRRSHLDEILYSLPNPPFEISGKQIRAKYRDQLVRPDPVPKLPKLLFTSIRKRAYRSVLDKGIFPTGYYQVVLSSSRDLAQRMGKRADQDPVMLSVHVRKSVENGVRFYQTGESLFLAESIPAGCFTGPPLPKEKTEPQKPDIADKASQPKMAGSYAVNLGDAIGSQPSGRKQQRRQIDWKNGKKRIKKQKRKRERPPWRK
ncbi:MAG: RNA 2'-phosphotransferase [Desulfobacterales bacterium]|jgi:putative RNA 2'-phosphotransferase